MHVVILPPEGHYVRVRDEARREFDVPHWLLKRQEVNVGGRWLDESDPRALDEIERIYRKIAAQRWDHGVEPARAAALRNIADVLTRHGRSVPADVKTGLPIEK